MPELDPKLELEPLEPAPAAAEPLEPAPAAAEPLELARILAIGRILLAEGAAAKRFDVLTVVSVASKDACGSDCPALRASGCGLAGESSYGVRTPQCRAAEAYAERVQYLKHMR